MNSEFFDARLRPPVEALPAVAYLAIAALLASQPAVLFPFLPTLSQASALAFAGLGLMRGWQAWQIHAYHRRLTRLPRYILAPGKIPASPSRLFLGRGFRWDQRHSQRLIEVRDPVARKYLEPGTAYRIARGIEHTAERWPLLRPLAWLTRKQHPLNPVAPLPEVGGDPALHGVGLEEEKDIYMPLGERVGHTLVLGTTRVGKTRLAELLITQDIRRGEVVIVFDPKGDIELLQRMWSEARRAGRLDQFHFFHLGYPEISERYNPVGEFGRITEVASRTTAPLPDQGNSAAFKEFAWRFTNVIAQALVGLGRKPDLKTIARYVTHIEPLLVDYFHLWLDEHAPNDWREQVQAIEADEHFVKKLPMALKGRDLHANALVAYYKRQKLYDPVCDGLKSTFEYDKTYFDKLTASLLPLIEKLTSGRIGPLLAPDYDDPGEKRPLLDWTRLIREGGIAYIGLDALSDPEVASAVGNAMFADLTSIAGKLYKHGAFVGLPSAPGNPARRIALHADEFNELIGNEFIPMVNKAGGAGIQVTAYTQTLADIEARIGDRAKADQIVGNFNSLIMLRVRNESTARLLTDQLPTVRVYTKIAESRTTDNVDPGTPVDFVSQNADRLSQQDIDMLTPADLISLPKGQAFALIEGGQLYKLRLPLAGHDPLWTEFGDIRQALETQYGLRS